jgi:hypothetical protein
MKTMCLPLSGTGEEEKRPYTSVCTWLEKAFLQRKLLPKEAKLSSRRKWMQQQQAVLGDCGILVL